MKKEVIIIVVIFLVLNIFSAYAGSEYEILLKSRHFTPAPGMSEDARSYIQSLSPERAHVLIQLYYIPSPEQRKELEAKGIKLLFCGPNKACFVSIPSNKSEEIAALPDVRAIVKILPDDKMSPIIRERGIGSYATNRDGSVNLIVIFFEDISLDEASKIVSNYNGKVVEKAQMINALIVTVSNETIIDLANDDSIQWIDEVPPPPVTANDGSRAAIGVNAVQGSPYNLKGSNIIAGEWDKGWVDNETHADLKGRVTLGDYGCTEEDCVYGDHPTHVAGTMLGNGTITWTYRGMAINATVISYEWWNTIEELEKEYNESINNYSIDLSTNSWGWRDYLGLYHAYSRAIDNVTLGAFGKKIPIIWAAGNQRPSNCDNGTYDCIWVPGTAKNTITVGAINSNDDSMTSFSSWGPTDDGRIKPDVVAAGCEGALKPDQIGDDPSEYIWSTWYPQPPDYYNYYGACGTSQATPAVSGGVALMLENWRRNYDNDPLPSTIKAILIQTAKDLGNTGPDYSNGYGRINVTKAIDLMNSDNDTNNIIFEDSIIKQNDTDKFAVVVLQGQSELKITLVWDDYPGVANWDPALVNNLDLIVKAPNGTRYYPWTLDKDNPGNSAVRTQADELNNVEQVYVSTADYSPLNGTWIIQINGTAVPQPKQAYSLVSNNPIIPPNDTNKFYIKNSSGGNVAWLGDAGNIMLKGTCTSGGTCTAPENSFIIANYTDTTTAYIDNNGNMCIEKGDCSDQSTSCNPTRDAFIIRNASDYNRIYIDFDGDLCLTGELYENSNP